VDDYGLDTVAYYHRGLAGQQHERLGAAMILGSSILTARGVPMAGEYELRTFITMLASGAIGAGGSFTEIRALNFRDGVVEMGHDGPAHLAISAQQPLMRALGVFHRKRGWGVSVEFDVTHGPATTFGVGRDPDGSYVFIASEGTVVPGQLLSIGNTTSRVDLGRTPGSGSTSGESSLDCSHARRGNIQPHLDLHLVVREPAAQETRGRGVAQCHLGRCHDEIIVSDDGERRGRSKAQPLLIETDPGSRLCAPGRLTQSAKWHEQAKAPVPRVEHGPVVLPGHRGEERLSAKDVAALDGSHPEHHRPPGPVGSLHQISVADPLDVGCRSQRSVAEDRVPNAPLLRPGEVT
jgi:hypothetical protein